MFFRKAKKTMVWLSVLVGSIAIFAMAVNAKTDNVSREYHLKAAFLRYVAKFVTWPEGTIPEDSLNICLYGEIPSLKGLNSINGRIVNDRPLLVRPVTKLSLANSCQIIFIANSEQPRFPEIIGQFKTKPIVTFGDMEGFAEIGGHMNFYVVNNRMAIMLNQITIADSNLTIHPRMMKLVTIVPDVDGSQSSDEAA